VPQVVTECLLCGGKPLTKEHIWPRWLQDVFEREDLAHTRGGDGPRVVPKEWHAPPFTAERLLLCDVCNNRRLGSLEGIVRPILTPMILALPQELSPETQGLLSRWAFKTLLMLHAAEFVPPEPIPRRHMDPLGQDKPLPDSLCVWIGKQDLTDAGYWIKPLLASRGGVQRAAIPNGYWATLSVGAVVVQILGLSHQVPDYVQEAVPVTAELGMRRIWPTQSGTITWPSAYAVTFEATKRLTEAFVGQDELTWDGPALAEQGDAER
jgi:hypothetical protein